MKTKTPSVYRKPTPTNLHTHYSSSTPQSSKDSVISSLTRRAHTICSPSHIEPEIQHIKQILLCNGYPLRRINLIMARTLKNLKKKKNPPSANILLPYPAGYHKDIKSTLQRYDTSTTFSSSTTLISLLNTNKAPTPKSNTMNTIIRFPARTVTITILDRPAHRLSNELRSMKHVTDSTTLRTVLAT